MKKLLTLVIIISLGAGLWYWSNSKNEALPEVEIMPTVDKPDASDATFIFEDGPITLTDGEASTTFDKSSLNLETTLLDTKAYGDINGDKKNDTVILLLQSSGGSGSFVYLAALVSGNVEYKGSNAVFIGDRISPKSLKISSGGTITLEYLDRRDDEPMAAEPTIATSKNFIYRSGLLEER